MSYIAREWVESVERPARAIPGSRTPVEAFKDQILVALCSLGGTAKVKRVLDEVEVEYGEFLNRVDREVLSSGMARWRKTAQFARLELCDSQLISRESPRGTWSLTPRGLESAMQLIDSFANR